MKVESAVKAAQISMVGCSAGLLSIPAKLIRHREEQRVWRAVQALYSRVERVSEAAEAVLEICNPSLGCLGLKLKVPDEVRQADRLLLQAYLAQAFGREPTRLSTAGELLLGKIPPRSSWSARKLDGNLLPRVRIALYSRAVLDVHTLALRTVSRGPQRVKDKIKQDIPKRVTAYVRLVEGLFFQGEHCEELLSASADWESYLSRTVR